MYKVLIVEDDPMVAMINEQYVRKNKQFSVVAACSDGKSALEFLQQNQVDLIVLDVFMPYMNGLEILRHIREKKIDVEVIMVTAANDRDSLEEAIHLGIVDYLVKPFAYDRFQMALDKFVMQTEAFKNLGTLNQKSIDYVMENTRSRAQSIRPKGIQEKTLLIIKNCLSNNMPKSLTSDDIAEKTGLTGVTVRRYMSYLEESGQVVSEINYETGGRPCLVYHLLQNTLSR